MAGLEFREADDLSSESFDSALVGCARVAIFAADSDGSILAWNHEAASLLGYSAEEMLGRQILDLFEAEDRAEERARLRRAHEGEAVEHHVRLRHKDGGVVHVSLRLSPLRDARGRSLGVSVVALDLSDQVRRGQAEEDFFSLLSHELRTPLTTILGYAQMLADPSRQFDDETRATVGERLLQRAEALQSLLENLLNAQRVNGEIALRLETMGLSEFIATALDILSDRDHARVALDFVEDRPLIGDPHWLSIALGNLVTNALKYSPPDRPVRLTVLQTPGATVFEVADEGPGIPADSLPNLFDRFVRAGVEQRQGPGGVGFGLYITRRIVEAHRGTIRVHSTEGSGTAFTMEIPGL